MKRLFAVALLVLQACSTLPIADQRASGPYGTALERVTRRATLYAGLETRAFVRATYLSPEFVAAQAAEISRMRAEPPAVASARLARMLEENRVPSFFVALHTPSKDWNDWNEPNSVWRLTVDLGHGQIDRPKVTRIDRPDAETLALYPYLDPFSIGYVLHFTGEPQPAPDSNLAVGVISSALGQVQFMAAGALGLIRLQWALPAQTASR
jgi:hypothetical protein